MKGLLSYSGVTTKIRAMEGRFFTDKEFEEIVQLPDVPAVAEYLKKNPGYANALSEIPDNMLHRGMIERYMENSLFRDYEKIYRFAKEDQQIFLRRYARRYEVRLLKQILSAIMQGEHVSGRLCSSTRRHLIFITSVQSGMTRTRSVAIRAAQRF